MTPLQPIKRQAYCALKWLVSYTEGTLRSVNEATLQSIKNDPSYRGHQIFFQPGGAVKKTQNCFTWGGCVLLANKSEEVLNTVYSRYLPKCYSHPHTMCLAAQLSLSEFIRCVT